MKIVQVLMSLALFTQSVWAAETSQLNESVNLPNISAQVVWNKSATKIKDDVRFDPKTQLYWYWNHKFNPFSNSGKQFIENFEDLTFNGKGGWHLPSFKEVMDSGAYSRVADFYKRKFEKEINYLGKDYYLSAFSVLVSDRASFSVLVSSDHGFTYHNKLGGQVSSAHADILSPNWQPFSK